MARTPNVKIQEWGTPPEPQPTGWDAVRSELDKKPGKWANVGEMTAATARRVMTDRLPAADGYESTTAPGTDERRVVLWVRKRETETTEATKPETKPAPTK